MDERTRPSHTHRQQRADTRRAAAVFLLLGMSVAAIANPSPHDVLDALPSPPKAASYDISVAAVEAGAESLAVAARLTETSAFVARDVVWKVRNHAGELLLDATASELQSPLPPGDYVIEAQYGAVHLQETVRLTPGKSIYVSFVLNAGGLRVLATVPGLSTGDFESRTLVYALSSSDRGKLVAQSDVPGELLKLSAGTYRVENRFGKGNTVAVTDVNVKPGKISAVDLAHVAGLARFTNARAGVHWTLRDSKGLEVVILTEDQQRMALKPGNYSAKAVINGVTHESLFSIVAGEEQEITLEQPDFRWNHQK